VLEPGDHPGQIAVAVTVAVLKGARIDLVDDGLLPPSVAAGPTRFHGSSLGEGISAIGTLVVLLITAVR
jgi:hypothetical protein